MQLTLQPVPLHNTAEYRNLKHFFFEILSTVFQSTPLPDPLQDLVEVCRRGSYRSLTTRIIITHNITYTMGSVGAPTKGCS